MEILQKQKFEGDLCLSPTALFYANLYNDIHLTIEEAAPHLRLTPATIRNRICAGTAPVPFFKLGGKWVVHVSDLAKYVDWERQANQPAKKRSRGAPKKSERMAVGG